MELELLGLGGCAMKGVRNGSIVDLQEASDAIRSAVAMAEKDAGVRMSKAFVGINGRGMRSFNSRGSVALGAQPAHVTRSHVNKCLEAARNISLVNNCDPVHDVVRQCMVDDELEVDNPIGMVGSRLEIGLHIITLPRAHVVNYTKAVNQAGVQVQRLVVQPLASAESAIRPEEKEFGALLVEIGAASTAGLVFQKGKIQHSFVIPVGGELFTRDIVTGLRTTLGEAEAVKCKAGVLFGAGLAQDETIEIAGAGSGKTRLVARQVLAEILRPRAQEVLEDIRKELSLGGFDGTQMSAAVFCGGGALLNQFIQEAEKCLEIPCRLGFPALPEGWPEKLSSPCFTGLLGLFFRARMANAERKLSPSARSARGGGMVDRTAGKVRQWFSDFLGNDQ